MKKRLLDLLAKKKAVLDKMKAADTANDQTAFDAAQAELAPIDAEIARVKAIRRAHPARRSTPTSACMRSASASAPAPAAIAPSSWRMRTS